MVLISKVKMLSQEQKAAIENLTGPHQLDVKVRSISEVPDLCQERRCLYRAMDRRFENGGVRHV